MKYLAIPLVVFALSLPAVAFAQGAPPPPPTTMVMPTQLLGAIYHYLNQRPYGEVAGLAIGLERCMEIQLPQHGVVMDHGECPGVSQVLQQQRVAPSHPTPPAIPGVSARPPR